jgi:NAD(P)-dependent dehydrogenase (short-subunit alcohol dehydrogenase family)
MTGENDTVDDFTGAGSGSGRDLGPDADPGPGAGHGPGAGRRRLAVVTGASSGIGLAAAVELARRGWSIALVGRDPARLDEAVTRVRSAAQVVPNLPGPAVITAYRSDFMAFASVRELAATLLDAYPSIDVLANNAGGAFGRRHTTVDGFERSIQVNHLAPFLLSHLLRPALAGGRIVNTASGAHTQGALDPEDLSRERHPYRQWIVYASTKQANILFTGEAARRWPEIVSVSFHPGVVRTRFGNDRRLVAGYLRFMPGLRTPEQGADTLVWLADTADTAESVESVESVNAVKSVDNGGYYMNRAPVRPRAIATDPELAARLWRASAAAVGLPD